MRHPQNLPRRTGLLLFAVLLLTPPMLFGQYTEGVDVRVIQVPVVVSRDSKPVVGLTKDDFEVFVNGKRHPIAYFDVLEFTSEEGVEVPGAVPAVPAAPAGLAQRRLTLLVFDVLNSSITQLSRLRADARDFINRLAPDDLVAVAVYGGSEQAHYLVPFTTDRTTVVRAISTLRPSQARDALALTMTPEERTAFTVQVPISPALGNVEKEFTEDLSRGVDDFENTIAALREDKVQIPTVLDAMQNEKEWQDQSAADLWAEALGGLADALRPLEGIKQIVLLSEGLRIGDVGTLTFGNTARAMHERFKNAGVVLNVIDIAGIRAPGGDSMFRNAGASVGTPTILFDAALGTGGRVINNTGVRNALRVFSESRRVTYLLGLQPPENERENNEIVVKVKGQPRFTEVSHRRGYSRTAEGSRNVSGLVLADAMLNDIRRNDVTVRVDVQQGSPTTVIDVGMPSNELLAHAFGGSVTVDVFLYVFDESKAVVGWKHRRMKLETEKTRALLKGAELVRRERFDLQPGRYAVKALVHIVGRDLLGFLRTDFEIKRLAE